MDFSAEWCVPCKKFAPTFDKVSKNYKNKVEFIHYDSEKGEGKVLADKYKVNSLPTVVFIDAKGKVSKYEKGILTEAELTKRTEDLLK
jgi:thiol-disulfide isomerase/thioredoxin